MATIPTLDCQDCGVVLRQLTAYQAQRIADDPYGFIVYCRSCKVDREADIGRYQED